MKTNVTVFWAVDEAVFRAVSDAVYEAVYVAMYVAVYDDPPHPALHDFLPIADLGAT